MKSVEEFMMKEIVKPLKKKELYPKINRPLRNVWALNYDKNCPIRENLPKIQQFKNYYFYKITQEDKDKYNRYFLESDHLAIRYPEKEIIENQRYPFLEMKSKFNPQSCTKNDWQPGANQLSMTNNSSVSYNIINNENNKLFLRPSASMNRINFRKIGVGHYADVGHPFYPNFNKEFSKAYENNKNIFKVYKGIFTKMYDDSSRNGNIYLPFDTKKSGVIK